MTSVWSLITAFTTLSQLTSTNAQGCSGNLAYIDIQSTLNTIPLETIISSKVNYAPLYYASSSIASTELIPYGSDHTVSTTFNNPCDINTWTVPLNYYTDKIVLVEYDIQFVTCSPQKWTLNLEARGAKAVLIANNAGSTTVYALSGDVSLTDPTIPTRMITQNDNTNIQNVWNSSLTETVFVSFDCFDTTSPSIICVEDDSLTVADHIQLDGEFQKQCMYPSSVNLC